MTIISVEAKSNQRRQFVDVFHNVIEYEAVWDPDSVGSNGETHEDIDVLGAQLGDMVLVSLDIDIQDLHLVAHVTADDVVTVGLLNHTAGAVNLGSINVHILLFRPTHSH